MSSVYTPTKADFWFLPLGGSGEIGMNLNLYGHDGQWLMVDLGINFNDRLGIEVLMPDPTFIEQQKHRLAGLVVTHAHEDHIGAIPHLWDFLECPIYATPFTAEIIKRKLKEKPWGSKVPIHIMPLDSRFKVGVFDLEYVHLTHSILESNALAIRTPLGTVMHSGDWKIDPVPMVGRTTDHHRLEAISDEGVLALVCDSTNVFNDDASGSEEAVFNKLKEVILSEKNARVVVSCFASNLARIHTICAIAEQADRRVCLAGRSLVNMVSAAQQQGYLKDLPQIIDDRTAMRLPKNKVLLLTTGSQGEAKAALSRIAHQTHPTIRLDANDMVIFSSRVIPGNEKIIGGLQNILIKKGCNLVTDVTHDDIHVSGHPGKKELKQMYEWTKPHLLVPTHGEFRHMAEQAKFGKTCGIEQTWVPENGEIISLLPQDKKRSVGSVPVGRLGVDGNSLVAMESDVIKERTRLSAHGAVFVTVYHSKEGYMTQKPKITIIGLTDDKAEHDEIAEDFVPLIRSQLNGTGDFQKGIEKALRQHMSKTFEKKPYVCVHLVQTA
ncbi:MAG: Ribonuclease J [Holosporales bacterium]